MTTTEPDDTYDPQADFEKSIEEAYQLVRARVAAGGAWWVPQAPGSRLPGREESSR